MVSRISPAKINPVGKVSKRLVKKRKAELKRLHKIYSWRKMAAEIYNNEVRFGTLERFATDPLYIPKDESLLQALDVLLPPNPYRSLPRWYHRTPEALMFFNTKRMQIKMMSDATRRQKREP